MEKEKPITLEMTYAEYLNLGILLDTLKACMVDKNGTGVYIDSAPAGKIRARLYRMEMTLLQQEDD